MIQKQKKALYVDEQKIENFLYRYDFKKGKRLTSFLFCGQQKMIYNFFVFSNIQEVYS